MNEFRLPRFSIHTPQQPPVSCHRPAVSLLLLILWRVLASLAAGEVLLAATVEESFEGEHISWAVAESGFRPRIVSHTRSREKPHRGIGCERIVLDVSSGTTLRLQTPIGKTRVIDEWRASLWVRADHPDIRLSVRVMLPNFIDPKTGRPVEVLVPGSISQDADRWEQLEVGTISTGLQQQLLALRAEHGPTGDLTGALATHLVLELSSSPGRYDVAIDDILLNGVVQDAVVATPAKGRQTATSVRDPHVRPAQRTVPANAEPTASPSAASPVESLADPSTGLARGVLEVGGLPFFPRALDHSGEPLEVIAAMGFNCVRLTTPASGELLAEARLAGIWVICPPPQLPDVDIRDPESLPVFSANWDRVLLWDMGSGLSEADVESLAERARRVRACDMRGGRAIIASADSGLRSISRHVDLLIARRTVLGTSVELADYLTWLRDRPRLMRPGTPLLATLSTELDPRTAQQAASLSGIGGRGLAVDPESLSLAAMTAVAAGTRGILFASSRRIDSDDHESRARGSAALAMNLKLKILEPWAAAGRFAASAQSSDSDVKAVVLEAARARMVVAWRCVQGSQIVARHYHGDIPKESSPLTLLVPGVPEAHQAWEVGPGGLRPLRQKRVTGGVSIVLDPFRSSSLVLLSGDPSVTAHVQQRVRELSPIALASARAQAAIVLADGAELLLKLPPAAMGNLPAAAMLSEAQRSAVAAEQIAASDPATAIAGLERAAAIAGQLERLAWERGVLATGSMVAGPLSTSDASLAEHWRFVEAIASTVPQEELLLGGAMERIEELSGNGWRHFAMNEPTVRTAVEISRTQPAGGKGSLLMSAKAANPTESPGTVETPPVWITTPPISPPSGKLLQIEARVWVPQPIKGSVDGLLVFDSIGGAALAERVGVTAGWRRLVLYRIVPADASGEPLVVTFALTGLGEAHIDNVSIRVLESSGQSEAGVPSTIVSTTPRPSSANGFPNPSEVLGQATATVPLPLPLPPVAAPTGPVQASAPKKTVPPPSTPQWPGMSLEWPKILPFGQSPNAPPPGPGGGKIDPFKRARPASSTADSPAS